MDGGLSNVGERIDGLSTEAYLNKEGLNRYDIRTYLKVPGSRIPARNGDMGGSEMPDKAVDLSCSETPDSAGYMGNSEIPDSAGDLTFSEKPVISGKLAYIKLLVNVEAQNDDKPGYDISLRALFYCCRMISAQQGVEFNTDADDPVKYGNIRKVYFIWVCTETAQKRANSIEKYGLDRTFLVGNNEDAPRYDIMNAIVINISKVHDTGGTQNELIRLLTDLFDERLNGAEKVEKLKDDYDLKMTKQIERKVEDMCTYSIAMEKKDEVGKIEYHYGFYGAVHVEYELSHVQMEYLQEHELGDEPVRMDMLILKQDRTPLSDPIGSFLKRTMFWSINRRGITSP